MKTMAFFKREGGQFKIFRLIFNAVRRVLTSGEFITSHKEFTSFPDKNNPICQLWDEGEAARVKTEACDV